MLSTDLLVGLLVALVFAPAMVSDSSGGKAWLAGAALALLAGVTTAALRLGAMFLRHSPLCAGLRKRLGWMVSRQRRTVLAVAFVIAAIWAGDAARHAGDGPGLLALQGFLCLTVVVAGLVGLAIAWRILSVAEIAIDGLVSWREASARLELQRLVEDSPDSGDDGHDEDRPFSPPPSAAAGAGHVASWRRWTTWRRAREALAAEEKRGEVPPRPRILLLRPMFTARPGGKRRINPWWLLWFVITVLNVARHFSS